MLKKICLPIVFAGLVLLAPGAVADTITLKNGERIEATISDETPTEITLEIQISAGIKDHRVVKKADVAKVDRIAADELAYRSIMHLLPGKNSLGAGQYESIIKALQGFVGQYPESTQKAAVLAALTTFKTEKKRVDAGEVKLDGLWLTKAEAQRQRIQIGGALTFNAMKTANAGGDAIGALNAFAMLEKNFAGSKVMPDAVELARQILAGLRPATFRAIESAKVLKVEREKGFADAKVLDRAELLAALQREEARTDAALAAATTANNWPPFIASSEKSLNAILAKITPEAQRLEKIPVAPMRASIKLADRAQTEFTAKDYAAATETLKEVTKLWPANESAVRLTALITEAKNPPKIDPAATPAPGTSAVTTAGKATPAALPAGATPAPGTPAAEGPPAAPATSAESPTPIPTTAAAEAPAEKPAEEAPKPLFMTLPGAISIVVGLAVILGLLNVFNKLRRRSEETIE